MQLLRQVILQIDKSGMNLLVACESGDYSSAGLIAALLMCTGEPVEREDVVGEQLLGGLVSGRGVGQPELRQPHHHDHRAHLRRDPCHWGL